MSGLGLFLRPCRSSAAGVQPVDVPVNIGKPDGMVARNNSLEKPGHAFRILSLATVAGILAVVAVGGVVRLTGSGLGCPDWPLCHGSLVPSSDPHTLIEYSHRMVAAVVGVLVLATSIMVWRYYRRQRWLLIPATAGIILLVVQVILGGITVMNELSPGLVVAHLAIAEALRDGHDGCLPLLFDDAFTNSDPMRLEAVGSMLRQAVDLGLQVVVLSCDPDPYRTIADSVIDLDHH